MMDSVHKGNSHSLSTSDDDSPAGSHMSGDSNDVHETPVAQLSLDVAPDFLTDSCVRQLTGVISHVLAFQDEVEERFRTLRDILGHLHQEMETNNRDRRRALEQLSLSQQERDRLSARLTDKQAECDALHTQREEAFRMHQEAAQSALGHRRSASALKAASRWRYRAFHRRHERLLQRVDHLETEKLALQSELLKLKNFNGTGNQQGTQSAVTVNIYNESSCRRLEVASKQGQELQSPVEIRKIIREKGPDKRKREDGSETPEFEWKNEVLMRQPQRRETCVLNDLRNKDLMSDAEPMQKENIEQEKLKKYLGEEQRLESQIKKQQDLELSKREQIEEEKRKRQSEDEEIDRKIAQLKSREERRNIEESSQCIDKPRTKQDDADLDKQHLWQPELSRATRDEFREMDEKEMEQSIKSKARFDSSQTDCSGSSHMQDTRNTERQVLPGFDLAMSSRSAVITDTKKVRFSPDADFHPSANRHHISEHSNMPPESINDIRGSRNFFNRPFERLSDNRFHQSQLDNLCTKNLSHGKREGVASDSAEKCNMHNLRDATRANLKKLQQSFRPHSATMKQLLDAQARSKALLESHKTLTQLPVKTTLKSKNIEKDHSNLCTCLASSERGKENRLTVCPMCNPVQNSNFMHRDIKEKHFLDTKNLKVPTAKLDNLKNIEPIGLENCDHGKPKGAAFVPVTKTVIVEKHKYVK